MARRAARSRRIDAPLSGERVMLRPLRVEDIAGIEPWYGEAAAAAGDADSLLITLTLPSPLKGEGEAAPIGVLDYRAGDPAAGWLTISFVAVAPAYRGLGYGSEAVRLLEDEARRRGLASRFRAEVEVRNGLCFYFWLRLGYRPAAEKSGASDTLAMVRTS